MPGLATRPRILAVALITLVAVAGVVGALYVQLSVQSLTVTLKWPPFISLGQSDLNVMITFELWNPSILSATVVDLPFSIELADYPLGTGNVTVPLIVPPSGHVESSGRIQIPYSQLSGVTFAALKQYLDLGTLKYRIYGTVTFRILFVDMAAPYDLSGDVFETLKSVPPSVSHVKEKREIVVVLL